MKMSSACSFIFMQIKVIFLRMATNLDSLWKRGTRVLGNGLFDLHENEEYKIFSYEWFCAKSRFGREAKASRKWPIPFKHVFLPINRPVKAMRRVTKKIGDAQSSPVENSTERTRHDPPPGQATIEKHCWRLGLYICYFPYLQYDVLTWDWVIWSKLISNHCTGPNFFNRRIFFRFNECSYNELCNCPWLLTKKYSFMFTIRGSVKTFLIIFSDYT